MAKKITIAELGLDSSAFLKKAESTKKSIIELKDAQKLLKNTGRESSQQFIKNEGALKKLSTEYNKQKKIISESNLGSKKTINISKSIEIALNKESKSIEQLRVSNKELSAIRNKLNLNTEKGRQQLTKLNAKIDNNNKKIKENVSGYEQTKIGIGGYEDAIRKVFPQAGAMIGNLKSMKTSLKATTTATNGGSKALKLFKIALISTGIGAIVVALGSLIAAFASTQKGADEINKALAPLKGAFQGIIGIVQDISLNVFGQLGDRFTVISGGILNGIDKIRLGWNKLSGDVEETNEIQGRIEQRTNDISSAQERLNEKSKQLGDIWKNSGKRIADAAEKQKEITKLQIEIEKKEANIVLLRAKNLDEIKKQELISKDRTKSSAQRAKAAERALQLSRELAQEEKNIISLKIREEKLTQSLNDSGREDLKKLNELKAEFIKKDTEQKSIELRFLGAKSAIFKEQKAKEKEQNDKDLADKKAFAKLKLKFENDAAIQSVSNKVEQDKIKIAQKLKADKAEIDALKVSHTEKEALKKQLTDEAKAKTDAIEDARLLEVNKRKKDLQNQIDLENAATDEEKEILKAEQDLEKHTAELDNLILTETEKTELKASLITQSEQVLADINSKFRKKDADETEKLEKKKIALRNKTFDAAADLFGRESRMGKAVLAIKQIFALKESIIERQKFLVKQKAAIAGATTANAEGVSQTAKVGFPQNIPLLIGYATQIGGIISAIKGAAFYEGGQVPYGSGGQISGSNIPTQQGGDNILATVKSGEVILNEEQQSRAGGSAFFKSIGVPGFQSGGQVGVPASVSAPIVAIESDITDAQIQQVEIIDGANI